MVPFLWIVFNYLKATVPLRQDSLQFSNKSPGLPSTHLIKIGRMESWVDLGAIQWSWTRDPWIGTPLTSNRVYKKKFG